MIPLQVTLLQTSRLQAPYTPWKNIMISIGEILEHPVLECCAELIVLFHERHNSHEGNAIVIIEDVDPGVFLLIECPNWHPCGTMLPSRSVRVRSSRGHPMVWTDLSNHELLDIFSQIVNSNLNTYDLSTEMSGWL